MDSQTFGTFLGNQATLRQYVAKTNEIFLGEITLNLGLQYSITNRAFNFTAGPTVSMSFSSPVSFGFRITFASHASFARSWPFPDKNHGVVFKADTGIFDNGILLDNTRFIFHYGRMKALSLESNTKVQPVTKSPLEFCMKPIECIIKPDYIMYKLGTQHRIAPLKTQSSSTSIGLHPFFLKVSNQPGNFGLSVYNNYITIIEKLNWFYGKSLYFPGQGNIVSGGIQLTTLNVPDSISKQILQKRKLEEKQKKKLKKSSTERSSVNLSNLEKSENFSGAKQACLPEAEAKLQQPQTPFGQEITAYTTEVRHSTAEFTHWADPPKQIIMGLSPYPPLAPVAIPSWTRAEAYLFSCGFLVCTCLYFFWDKNRRPKREKTEAERLADLRVR